MMQILLTVIGLAMAAGAGYALILNFSTQSISSEVAVTTERLDLAAASIARMAKVIPGTDVLSPPAATYDAAVGYSTMPEASGPFDTRIDGVPFLYCPLGHLTNAQVAQLGGTTSGTLYMTSQSRGEVRYGSLVVQSALSADIDAGVQTTFDPIAIIVAPDRDRTVPPSCNAVRLSGGRLVVTNGIARAVSNTRGLEKAKGVLDTIYVSSAGTGGGTGPHDRASIGSALSYYAYMRPERLTISIADGVVASSAAWTQFVSAAGGSSGSLAIVGETIGTSSLRAPSGSSLVIPENMSLRNIAIAGPHIVVQAGDKLTLTGRVDFYPGSSSAAVSVLKGGELRGQAGLLTFDSGGGYAVRLNGKARFASFNLAPINSVPGGIFYIDGGELDLQDLAVGSDSSLPVIRPSVAPFYLAGMATMASNSNVIARTASSGNCLNPSTSNPLTKWVSSSTLRIPDEDAYPAPGVDDPPAAQNLYEEQRQERFLGRQHINTAIDCV